MGKKKIFGLRTKVWCIIAAVAVLAVFAALFYKPKGPEIPEETMTKIKENLQEQIYQIIRKNSENIENIKFEKFWTEQVSSNTVKAHFVITYDAPMSGDSGQVTREGSMLLTKLDDTPEEQVWIADAVNVGGEQISFENGLKFKAGDEGDSDEEAFEYGEDGLYEDSYIDGETELDIEEPQDQE